MLVAGLCRGLIVLLVSAGLGVAAVSAGPIERQILEEQGGWSARFEIDCFSPGQLCGRFDYRKLSCRGGLEYLGASEKGFEFREKLETGKCAPGCLIILDSDLSRYRESCFGKLIGEGLLSQTGSRSAVEVVETNPKEASAKPGGMPADSQDEPGRKSQQVDAPVSVVRDCKRAAAASAIKVTRIQAATTTYLGDFRIDPGSGVVSGSGRVEWANGDLFFGTLVNGKKNGKGCFAWANGQQYDGDWLMDQQNGHAVILFADGNRYAGEVHDGLPNGEGVFASVKGDQYSGTWQAGQKHGKGRFVWSSNQSYSGDWVNDQPAGVGEIIYANGDKYSGEVSGGVPQGRGVKLFAASGDRYEGGLSQGEADGEGIYQWKSGDKYIGAWRAGQKHGQGRYTWANGDYWEGVFEADRQADGVLHVASIGSAGQEGVAVLLQQTRTASEATSGKASAGNRTLDRSRMQHIPMVAAELQQCSRPSLRANCPESILDEMEQGGYFKHDWQTMFSEKTPAGGLVSYEVDRSSVSSRGVVFSWFRFLDSVSGGSRKTGVKYDCRSRALEIQLLFNCEGGAQPRTCVLDQNFDKYVGKAIPAATIKGWFKSACERSVDQ